MSPTGITNSRVLFNERPTGYPEPGKTTVLDRSRVIDLDNVQLNGGALVKLLVSSIDPYLRGKMKEKSDAGNAFEIGKPLYTLGVGKIIRSENPNFTSGELLYGEFDLSEYFVLTSDAWTKKIDNKSQIPLSCYVGVCGMPGQTAYYGYKGLLGAHVKKGDTLFVTTGAGPVGSFIIQLAKADGLKVIASAGSEEKVEFMKECGADVAFNYKTTSTAEVLEREGPINFFWDHVGGEMLDAALNNAASYAKVVICGQTESYNGQGVGVKRLEQLLWKRITMYGYCSADLEEKYGKQFAEDVPPRVAKREIKYREDVRRGLESVGKTLYDVQAGKNTGKAVIVIADE